MYAFLQRRNGPEPRASLGVRSNRRALPSQRRAHPLLSLQRTVGNQAVWRMLRATVDEYERDADRIAAQTVDRPERACACGGQCPKCRTTHGGDLHDRVQTKPVQASDAGQSVAPTIVHEALAETG